MLSGNLKKLLIIILTLSAGLLAYSGVHAQGDVTNETGFKKLKPAASYGTVVMDRSTRNLKDAKPVVFPHWVHRTKYACSACHVDLGFKMTANETGVRQPDIEAGKYCGACHNGTAAFGAGECSRCHSYGIKVPENKRIEESLKDLPKDHFGNMVNWAAAQKEGKIKPAAKADGKGALTSLDLDIVIPVTKFVPAPPNVKFPHKAHTELLECAACHPSIFKQQKGGNPDMNMMKIIAGQYCGVCHGKVAFPLNDCFRCHSEEPPPPPKLEEPKKDEKPADKK